MKHKGVWEHFGAKFERLQSVIINFYLKRFLKNKDFWEKLHENCNILHFSVQLQFFRTISLIQFFKKRSQFFYIYWEKTDILWCVTIVFFKLEGYHWRSWFIISVIEHCILDIPDDATNSLNQWNVVIHVEQVSQSTEFLGMTEVPDIIFVLFLKNCKEFIDLPL